MERYGRSDSVTLETVAKKRTPDECQAAAQYLSDANLPILLGHNKVQEARATHDAIRSVPNSRIHLIGNLQTNKINQALRSVDLIETVDSRHLVEAIDTRVRHGLKVFLQINVSLEESKHGCSPEALPDLVEAVATSRHLEVSGLMTVGANSPDEKTVRASFSLLRDLRENVAIRLDLPEDELDLSMGMSRDLEWAIAEGATIVRVGTDIFGSRP